MLKELSKIYMGLVLMEGVAVPVPAKDKKEKEEKPKTNVLIV